MAVLTATLCINAVCPFLVYSILIRHYSSFAALLAASLIPLLDNVWHLVRHRRLDAFGFLMLVSLVLSALAALLGGNERLILVRESLVTGVIGLLFIGSLSLDKPLLFWLAGRFLAKPVSARLAEHWGHPRLRAMFRCMTAVWGILLLVEALLRVLLVFCLKPAAVLALSGPCLYIFIGGAALWTYLYRMRNRAVFASFLHTQDRSSAS
ncbi:hypothetical protein AWM70_21015 [Paenibacillus yonginensis]|uniref:Uncharacterized protein n=1 Tax=Paenibacillus yonginensis TaxID=1462996 RepID=A0A1B1N5S2_9BACL|nr:VC0807 family protein [Paenibacillus yonginensis]ANS76757.1 hypothetical protein AWM70_21015 [Paenibacillus yonginensis]